MPTSVSTSRGKVVFRKNKSKVLCFEKQTFKIPDSDRQEIEIQSTGTDESCETLPITSSSRAVAHLQDEKRLQQGTLRHLNKVIIKLAFFHEKESF